MSLPFSIYTEMLELLDAVCRGHATEEQLGRIEQLALGNHEAMELYVDYLDNDALMHWWSQERRGQEAVVGEMDLQAKADTERPRCGQVALPTFDDARSDFQSDRRSPILGFLGDVGRQGLGFVADHAVLFSSLAALVMVATLIAVFGRNSILGRQNAIAKSEITNVKSQIPDHEPVLKPRLPAPEAQSIATGDPTPDGIISAPASPLDMDTNWADRMLDPATDKAGEPWCYLAKSTTVIGVPFQPDVTQITYDGSVFTRNAELCFFYGPHDRPLLAREKTFLEGWMPVVEYAWREGDIAYEIEYFAAPLDGESAENTVNFVQLRMHNAGNQTQTGRFAAALRHNGGDHRFGGSSFSPSWKYEMANRIPRAPHEAEYHAEPDGYVFRDGKLAYAFSPSAHRETVPGIEYRQPFLGLQYGINARSECCLARYRHELKPGESFAATFKMPRVPVTVAPLSAAPLSAAPLSAAPLSAAPLSAAPLSAATYLSKLAAADYATYRANTVGWWKKLSESGATFTFPEKCVEDAQRASLVHVLLATRTRNGQHIQTDGLPYPDFYLTGAPQEGLIYLTMGHPEFAKEFIVPNAIRQQLPDGLYDDLSLEHAGPVPTSQGHVLFISAASALYTQDKNFGAGIFPSIVKAVGYIEHSVQTDPYGLLPPAYPYDNEMIDGHYASNNFWALLGLRNAIRLARFLGQDAEAMAWTKLHEQYEANILKAITASAKPDGYVPPGLYPYLTGKKARRGFNEYQTHCDWENMLLAFPSEVLAPQDPRVKGTVEHVRKGYAEGVMTYRHGMHLHQYITANQIEQYMVMGDSRMALKDFYHVLLHAGPTYECFENLVRPWTDREVESGCPPPHAWASAKLGVLIRDLVLLEYGGKCGLEPAKRELWLFHCLSAEWTKPGDTLSFNDAPTEFGTISAKMTSSKDSANITIATKFHTPPACFRIRIPYFKMLRSYETDAKIHSVDDNCLLLSTDATRVAIKWDDKPGANLGTFADLLTEYRKANTFDGVDRAGNAIVGEHTAFLSDDEKHSQPQPLNFALVREAFQHEYARRAAGAGKLVHVESPALLKPVLAGLVEVPISLVGGKATATSNEPGFGPEKAIDGSLDRMSSWRASPYPQSLSIQLEKPRLLRGLHVWPYWGNGRYYRYTVEISVDGKTWTVIGDRSRNTSPATEAGEQFLFAPAEVRAVRVHMLYNSLNEGVHVVEVMGIDAKPEN